MKISRWKMIWGLKDQLFLVFTFYCLMALGVLFGYMCSYNKSAVIFSIVTVGISFYFYVTELFGYIIDIIFKNIEETDWIPAENIHYVNNIPGFGSGNFCGCVIKVFEDGKKPKKLNDFVTIAPRPEGIISQYKIYYLKNCKAIVCWEGVKVEKEKINLSRKPRKSK